MIFRRLLLLFLLCAASCAWGTACSNTIVANWTCVLSVSANSGGTSTADETVGSISVTLNQLLVLACTGGTSGTVLSVSDTQGNTWTGSVAVGQSNEANAGGIRFWLAIAKATGSTTFHCKSASSQTFVGGVASNWTNSGGTPGGEDTSNNLDTTAPGSGCPCTLITTNSTTTVNGDLLLAYFTGQNGAFTCASGWTTLDNVGGSLPLCGKNQTTASSSTTWSGVDSLTSDFFCLQGIAVKAPTGAAAKNCTLAIMGAGQC